MYAPLHFLVGDWRVTETSSTTISSPECGSLFLSCFLPPFQVEASTRTHITETRHAHLDQLHDSAVTLNQVCGIQFATSSSRRIFYFTAYHVDSAHGFSPAPGQGSDSPSVAQQESRGPRAVRVAPRGGGTHSPPAGSRDGRDGAPPLRLQPQGGSVADAEEQEHGQHGRGDGTRGRVAVAVGIQGEEGKVKTKCHIR